MKCFVLAGFLIVVFSQSLVAKTLTWDDCLQLAKQNNLDLQIAETNVSAAAQQKAAARSGFLPRISASASKNKNSVNQIVTDSYSAQLNLSQNIFAGFSDLTKLNQAELKIQNANINLQIAKAKLSAELKQNFESLNFAQAHVKLVADIEQGRQDNLNNVELRFNGGRENKGSVLLSRAYLSQAKYENNQAKYQLNVAREQLIRTLGITDSDQVEVLGKSPNLVKPANEPDFLSLIEQTPEYRLIKNQQALAQANLDAAKVSFYPSLDFNGSYGKVDSVFFPRNETWSAGIILTIPLFDGGRDYYTVKAAASQLAVANKTRENSAQQIRINLRQAYINFVQSVDKALVDEDFRRAAEVRARVARNKYNNGLMSFDDWDVIENDLILKQKANLISLRERSTNESQWEQILGTGVIQ